MPPDIAESAIDAWAARCRSWAATGRDVFVYFDNDIKGYAPFLLAAIELERGAAAAGGEQKENIRR